MSSNRYLFAAAVALTGSVNAREVAYYYTDPQGTVLAETDAQGNIRSSSDFRPFGGFALGVAQAGMGYTGHFMDVNEGLIYMKARYFDAESGRFLTRDPMPVRTGAIASFSRFAYVANNPLSLSDPTGMYICKGDGKNCDSVATAVATISKAAGALAAGSAMRVKLESVAKLYGKPGEANGVTVQFANLGGSAVANTVTKGNEVTVTVDAGRFASQLSNRVPESREAEWAATMAHEGSHGLAQRASTIQGRDAVFSDEQNAYRTQGSVNQGLGISSIYGIWTQGDSSVDEETISTYAEKSAENWCNAGGKC